MKKLFSGIVAILAIAGIAHISSQPTKTVQLNSSPSSGQATPQATSDISITPAPTATATPTPSPTLTPAPIASPANTGASDTDPSNDTTYTNVDGNSVHSPANSTDSSVPAGATAQCADGTYSFSQHHSGTCSRHRGVGTWL
jgi:hypothetical protein